MSTKQATAIALGLVGAVTLFFIVYSMYAPSKDGSSSSVSTEKSAPGQAAQSAKPSTPDSVADEIEGQSQDDATAFDNAESDEVNNVNDGSDSINDLSNVYDESEIE